MIHVHVIVVVVFLSMDRSMFNEIAATIIRSYEIYISLTRNQRLKVGNDLWFY